MLSGINKIFCIGYQKTGTTSLHLALKTLGYKVCGTRSDLIKRLIEKNDYESIWDVVNNFDAFEDHPWPNLFKELDQRYPNSKFILSVRDPEKWIKSCELFFDKPHFVQKWNYGVDTPREDKGAWLKVYNQHNETALKYFSNRPDDLLVVNWEKGHGWEEICSFLSLPIPDVPFPRANSKDDHWYKKSKTIALVLKKFPFLIRIKKSIFN